ncbi:MAG TPA: IS66 family transposase [Acetobacteraceae bacterium]|nr:IS66 family transposase [Acetobacteraceae bacterium]
MSTDLDLSKLTHAEKGALILTLLARLDEAHKLIAELRARIDDLTRPGKTPDNSSVPPSKGQKPNRPDTARRDGPRKGSLGRTGGGRALTAEPDEVVVAKAMRCRHCQAAFSDADQMLDARYDKIDLPKLRPVVTQVERYAGRCRCCGGTTLAALPEGLEPGTPFSLNIVALAMYLRFVHAVSYRRLSRLLLDLFALRISEGALDAAFRRGKPRFDADVAAILARLRRARVICSDETGVRIDGRGCWNWAEPAKVPPMRSIGGKQAEGFQNAEVVIHVVRHSRGADVVAEVLAGHRPALWVSDLSGAQQGHAEHWQVCLAHQLRDCQYAIEAGDAVFAPRMKALLLRAVVLARRHRDLAETTRRAYRRQLEHALDAVMALAPSQRDGRRLRKRYAKVRDHLFTFLEHPEIAADNNSSERELRPTATYRKVTGGFRSDWGADLFAAVRSVIGTAARRGIDAYQAIRETLRRQSALAPG